MTEGNGIEFVIRGRAITPKLIGRFELFFQIIWTAWIVFRIAITREKINLLVSDLVPHAIMSSKVLCPSIPHLLYCHYPDQLMSSREKSGWYGLYRAPLDWIEARSFKLADLILVNSKFTLDAVRSVVPDLKEDAARVLYPGA